jgi:hypothetical protein
MGKNLSKIIILQLSRLENGIVTRLQILGICALETRVPPDIQDSPHFLQSMVVCESICHT